MSPFAIYRLPYAKEATLVQQTEGEPAEYGSCTKLSGKSGFVIAPFQVTAQQPILLLRPDVVKTIEVRDITHHSSSITHHPSSITHHPSPITSSYATDFANCHALLKEGRFRKIVLARCADETMRQALEPMALFHRACALYPRMFISLVNTQKSGCWLTATPEILLETVGNQWRTIALAGTMKLEGDALNFDTPPSQGETGVAELKWSTKDIQEQRIVATYITECLEQFATDIREEGPRTVRAANLVHLRSDFTFAMPGNDTIGKLLHVLHPTPAVCGLPKQETFDYIVSHEHTPRRYYSGFMGPLSPTSTHIYVSLRCMNIEGSRCHLYAGGGLLKDSVLQQEWAETEAKMETMRRLLLT